MTYFSYYENLLLEGFLMINFLLIVISVVLIVIYVSFLYTSFNKIDYLIKKTDFYGLKDKLITYSKLLSDNDKELILKETKEDLVDSFYLYINQWNYTNKKFVWRLKKRINISNYEGSHDDLLFIVGSFIKLIDNIVKEYNNKNLAEKYTKGFDLMGNRVSILKDYSSFIIKYIEK